MPRAMALEASFFRYSPCLFQVSEFGNRERPVALLNSFTFSGAWGTRVFSRTSRRNRLPVSREVRIHFCIVMRSGLYICCSGVTSAGGEHNSSCCHYSPKICVFFHDVNHVLVN